MHQEVFPQHEMLDMLVENKQLDTLNQSYHWLDIKKCC